MITEKIGSEPATEQVVISGLDTGLICLVMLARFHQVAVEPSQLAHEFGQAGTAFGVQDILLVAKKLKARPLKAVHLPEGADDVLEWPAQPIAQSSSIPSEKLLEGNRLLLSEYQAFRSELLSRDAKALHLQAQKASTQESLNKLLWAARG